MSRTYELIVKATKQPTRLVNLDIDVAVYGFIAKTTATMTFKNETDNDTEGELIFPLPDGAAMCAYAVDINGSLVDGVVIEKEKARVAFESEARKTVEKPQVSIAESVVGNIFKTRIFPLPKNKTRVIRVAYVEQLTVKPGVSAEYSLPILFTSPIEAYTLRTFVEVTQAGVPKLDSDFSSGEELAYRPVSSDEPYFGQKRYVFTKTSANQPITKGAKLLIPSFNQTVVLDNDEEGQWYFALSHAPVINTDQSKPAPVQSIGIFWDASKSRQTASKEIEIRLLRALLTKLGTAKVELVVFRDILDTPVFFNIVNGSCQPLIDHLEKSVVYDGGSNLGALDARKGTSDAQSTTIAYWLLFSDGLHNVGVSNTPTRMTAPIYPLTSADQANHTLLRIFARKSGGEYFKLTPSANIADIVKSIGSATFSFLGLERDETLVSDIFPSIPTSVNDFTFKFAGRILKLPKAGTSETSVPLTVTFNYGIGTKVLKQHRCEISLPRATQIKTASSPHRLAVRFWAQRKIEELQQFPDIANNKELITEMGRKYSIVTDNTSFIVLESLDAYLKYEIEPPQSLPEVYKEYHEIMQVRAREKREQTEEKVHDVLDFWRRRVAWYNEDQASPEAQERHYLHCFKFGDGIDVTNRILATEWTQFKSDQESKKSNEEQRKKKLIELAGQAVYQLVTSLTELETTEKTLVGKATHEKTTAQGLASVDGGATRRALARSKVFNQVGQQLATQRTRLTTAVETLRMQAKSLSDESQFQNFMARVGSTLQEITREITQTFDVSQVADQAAKQAEPPEPVPEAPADDIFQSFFGGRPPPQTGRSIRTSESAAGRSLRTSGAAANAPPPPPPSARPTSTSTSISVTWSSDETESGHSSLLADIRLGKNTKLRSVKQDVESKVGGKSGAATDGMLMSALGRALQRRSTAISGGDDDSDGGGAGSESASWSSGSSASVDEDDVDEGGSWGGDFDDAPAKAEEDSSLRAYKIDLLSSVVEEKAKEITIQSKSASKGAAPADKGKSFLFKKVAKAEPKEEEKPRPKEEEMKRAAPEMKEKKKKEVSKDKKRPFFREVDMEEEESDMGYSRFDSEDAPPPAPESEPEPEPEPAKPIPKPAQRSLLTSARASHSIRAEPAAVPLSLGLLDIAAGAGASAAPRQAPMQQQSRSFAMPAPSPAPAPMLPPPTLASAAPVSLSRTSIAAPSLSRISAAPSRPSPASASPMPASARSSMLLPQSRGPSAPPPPMASGPPPPPPPSVPSPMPPPPPPSVGGPPPPPGMFGGVPPQSGYGGPPPPPGMFGDVPFQPGYGGPPPPPDMFGGVPSQPGYGGPPPPPGMFGGVPSQPGYGGPPPPGRYGPPRPSMASPAGGAYPGLPPMSAIAPADHDLDLLLNMDMDMPAEAPMAESIPAPEKTESSRRRMRRASPPPPQLQAQQPQMQMQQQMQQQMPLNQPRPPQLASSLSAFSQSAGPSGYAGLPDLTTPISQGLSKVSRDTTTGGGGSRGGGRGRAPTTMAGRTFNRSSSREGSVFSADEKPKSMKSNEESLAFQSRLVAAPDESLDDLVSSVSNLKSIAMDINELVADQSVMLDSIDQNIDFATRDVLSGLEELQAAENYRISAGEDEYNEEEAKEIREAMSLFDADGAGRIGRDTMLRVMSSLGEKPKDSDMDQMFATAGADGKIDLYDFFRKVGGEKAAKYLPKEGIVHAPLPAPALPPSTIENMTVKTETQTYVVSVDLTKNVSDLKTAIELATLVPSRMQILQLQAPPPVGATTSDKRVDISSDSATLASHGVNYKSVFHLSLNTSFQTSTDDKEKVAGSWAAWRMRQAATWRDFESHTDRSSLTDSSDLIYLRKWQEARYTMLQARIKKQLEEIDLEFRRTAALRDGTIKFDEHAIARGRLTPLPLPESSGTYMGQLANLTDPKAIYDTYVRLRDAPNAHYAKLSSFYFDVANMLLKRSPKSLGIRALSSLAELEFDDPQPLRVMAYRLETEANSLAEPALDVVVSQYRRIVELRPEEPQSHRDLALILVRKANLMMVKSRRNDTTVAEEQSLRNQARQLYTEAIALFTKVLMGKWDSRFDQVQQTVLTDMNRVIGLARHYDMADIENSVDRRLISPLELDLRVVIRWDTDLTNVELHVKEPSGEVCSPWNNRTGLGGMASRDMSKGYGPCEYLIKRAPTGEFKISTKLFATLERPTGTTVSVTVFTDFGRPELEQERAFIYRIHKEKDVVHVCNVAY